MISSKANPMKKVHFDHSINHSVVTSSMTQVAKPPRTGSHVQDYNGNVGYANHLNTSQLKPTIKPMKNPVSKRPQSTHETKSITPSHFHMQHLLEQKRSLQRAIESQRLKNESIRNTIWNNQKIYGMKLEETRRQINVLKDKYQEYEDEIRQLEVQAMNLGF